MKESTKTNQSQACREVKSFGGCNLDCPELRGSRCMDEGMMERFIDYLTEE